MQPHIERLLTSWSRRLDLPSAAKRVWYACMLFMGCVCIHVFTHAHIHEYTQTHIPHTHICTYTYAHILRGLPRPTLVRKYIKFAEPVRLEWSTPGMYKSDGNLAAARQNWNAFPPGAKAECLSSAENLSPVCSDRSCSVFEDRYPHNTFIQAQLRRGLVDRGWLWTIGGDMCFLKEISTFWRSYLLVVRCLRLVRRSCLCFLFRPASLNLASFLVTYRIGTLCMTA